MKTDRGMRETRACRCPLNLRCVWDFTKIASSISPTFLSRIKNHNFERDLKKPLVWQPGAMLLFKRSVVCSDFQNFFVE